MTATITNTLYVKDHYEVFYTFEEKNYQGQFYAVRSDEMEAQLQSIVDAYINGDESPLKGVQEITEYEPEPLTQLQIDTMAKEQEVDTLRAQKNIMSTELSEMAEYLKTGESLKEVSTSYATLHAQNIEFTNKLTDEYMLVYADYVQAKSDLETLRSQQ